MSNLKTVTMNEDLLESQFHRAFKRLKVSTNKPSDDKLTQSNQQAVSSCFKSPINIQANCFARRATRIRRNSCPERVASDVGVDRPVVRPLSPTYRKCDPTTRLSNQNLCAASTPQASDHTLNTKALLPETAMRKHRSSGTDKRRVRSKAQKRTTCSDEARRDSDMSVDELAGYFDEQVHIPRKMSFMAELMYT